MLRASRDVHSASKAAIPMRKPATMIEAAIARDIRRVGLLSSGHSEEERKPHCARRWSNCMLVSTRRTIAARRKPNTIEISTATSSAAVPGKRSANLVRNRSVDWANACLISPHIGTSIATSSPPTFAEALRVESIGPAPARNEIGLGGFVRDGQAFEYLFDSSRVGRFGIAGKTSNPGQVERRHGFEQVVAIDGAKAMGQRKIVDDAYPQIVGHAKLFERQTGELSEFKKRGGRKHQYPDPLQGPVSQLESFDHASDVHCAGVLR